MYEAYLASHADAGSIWIQLGHVLVDGGKREEAGRAYRTGLERGADAVDGWLSLHSLHAAGGDEAAASEAFAKALAAGPRHPEILRRLEGTAYGPALLDAIQAVCGRRPAWGSPGHPRDGPSFARLMLLSAGEADAAE